jgi:putative photosynthetic complex assembly protein 2
MIVAIALIQKILGTDGAEAVGSALLLTLLSLAILEHSFMMLPLSDGALWVWAMPVNERKSVEKSLR